MLPTAHIASALLVNRITGLDRGMTTAVFGALVPDAIDKTLAWVIQAVPAARHIAHTLLATSVLTAGAMAVLGRRRGAAFGAAYLTHLVGDLWDDGHVPWLMPFKSYDAQGEPWEVEMSADKVLLEIAGAATIVLLMTKPSGGEGAPRPPS